MNVLGMGPLEVLVVLLIAFIVLGPERMVDAGRLLGRAAREMRRLSDELPRLTLDDLPDPTGEKPRSRSESPTSSGMGNSRGPTDGPDGDSLSDEGEGPVAFEPSCGAGAPGGPEEQDQK